MLLNELLPGTIIEIQISKDGTNRVIKSKVDSCVKDGIKVIYPVQNVGISDDDEIYVNYKSEGKYRHWKCTRGDMESSGGVMLITLICNTNDESINRRNAYRVPYLHEVTYKCNELTSKGLIVNISNIGVCLYSNIEHSLEDFVSLVLVDKIDTIEMEGIIVRSSLLEDGRYKYNYGILLHGKDMHKISQFVLAKQREILRNRKGLLIK